MATEAVKQNNEVIKPKKKSIKSKIIPIVTTILLISIFFIVARYNVFGLGTKISSLMSKVPIIGSVFKDSNTINKNETSTTKQVDVSNMSKTKLEAQFKAQIKINNGLNAKIQNLNNANIALTNKINSQSAKVKNYNALNKKYTKLVKDKIALDAVLAKADSSQFIKYYEKMNPQVAQSMYSSLNGKTMQDKELSKNMKKIVAYYSSMEADTAAPILSKLYSNNRGLAVSVFSNMNSTTVTDIMAAMDANTAQKLTQDLYSEGVKNIAKKYGAIVR